MQDSKNKVKGQVVNDYTNVSGTDQIEEFVNTLISVRSFSLKFGK